MLGTWSTMSYIPPLKVFNALVSKNEKWNLYRSLFHPDNVICIYAYKNLLGKKIPDSQVAH
jgi:hypothetical protein